MGGRLRGCLWLTAGLVVAILAGAVAYLTLQRAANQQVDQELVQGPQVEVVVAAGVVELRSQLTAEDIEVRQVPVESAPEGAISTLEDAVGKVTLVDLYPGEVVLNQRLLDPNIISADGRLALVLEDEQVLMAFPTQDLMSRIDVLKAGDRVDILVSLDFPVERGLAALPPLEEEEEEEERVSAARTGMLDQEEQATFNLLQNVSIAAVVTGRTVTGGESDQALALLLTVSPQDALLLKYAKDAGGDVDIVLRAPGVERPFTTEPVDVDFMINRYRIPTEIGR